MLEIAWVVRRRNESGTMSVNDSVDRLRSALADRYTIEHELGAGGMATVYLAELLRAP